MYNMFDEMVNSELINQVYFLRYVWSSNKISALQVIATLTLKYKNIADENQKPGFSSSITSACLANLVKIKAEIKVRKMFSNVKAT